MYNTDFAVSPMRVCDEVCVAVPNLEEYKNAFLIIYNTVKSEPELLKVYNDYDDQIFVICEHNVLEDTAKFLSQFGEIIFIRQIAVRTIEVVTGDRDWNKCVELECDDIEYMVED